MTSVAIELALMLLVILAASELFTNALEHLGARLQISEGVTASLFAAVATAMPETLVPLLALLAGGADTRLNEEVGVGAILGAPVMLSTLTTSLMALAALPRRGLTGHLRPERSGLMRDLDFFLLAFALAAAAMFVPRESGHFRILISVALILSYCVYVFLTLRASRSLVAVGHGTASDNKMFLEHLGFPPRLPAILLQLGLGLGLLVFGARGFIHGVEGASRLLGLSALLLSLLIIPIATELPEKINSILWIRRGKDTLAFGNVTGAMVFQGTLLPAIGITLTPWNPRIEVLTGVCATLLAAAWLRYRMYHGGLQVWTLLVNGGLYLAFLAITLMQ